MTVRSAGRVILVSLDEIDYIESEANYVRLHAGGTEHKLRRTMNEIESELDPGRFVRIHRSKIVNISRVRELRPLSHGRYEVILTDGTSLNLSRGQRSKLPALVGPSSSA